MRFVKPLDHKMLDDIFTKYDKVITVEDGCIQGGFGSAVLEYMVDKEYSAKVIRLGIPDLYVEHGTQAELWKECNYDKDAIKETVKKMVTLERVAQPS